MRESSIERGLVQRVKRADGLCLKLSPVGLVGIPDRLVLLPGGRVFFIELKRPGGVIAPLQTHWGQVLRDLGFNARICIGKNDLEAFYHEVGI